MVARFDCPGRLYVMTTLKSTPACASGSSVASRTPGLLRIDVCSIWTRLIVTAM